MFRFRSRFPSGSFSISHDPLRALASVVLVALAIACAGCGNSDIPTTRIKHVVIIFQENRTPDNLFHGLPNADIADSGLNSKGELVSLTPVPLSLGYDMDHSHAAFVAAYHRGKMDGADRVGAFYCQPNCPPNAAYRYVNPADVKPYFDLAEQYTFGDRMFQTNQGPSFPAHQFIISGTSAPSQGSDMFASENLTGLIYPMDQSFDHSTCANAQQVVMLIDPLGREDQMASACFEHPTLLDLLDAQGIDWKYYTTSFNWESSLWTAPSAIRHLRFGPDWTKVIPSSTQIFRDIANDQLPTVSWVIPTGQASDHAQVNTGEGPSWVAAVVNAIGNSHYWNDTAIFITWDDWGGWYDHVAPPIYNAYEYGFRVPLIVVSPYAKAHYVSHQTHDFGSILRFIEDNYKLGTLGYADSRADNLYDCFDFTQEPLTFQTIQAPLDADYFLNDKRPAADPDDD